MVDESTINRIISRVKEQGTISKKQVLSDFGIQEKDYAIVQAVILKRDTKVRKGPKKKGGFVLVDERRGRPSEADLDAEALVFKEKWQMETVKLLSELLSYSDLEEVIGPALRSAVRTSRKERTGEDRRGSRRELASALVIKYGSDLLAEGEIRELIARKLKLKNPGRWHPGKVRAVEFVEKSGFPSSLAGDLSLEKPADFELLEGQLSLHALTDFQLEAQRKLSHYLGNPGGRCILTLPTGAGKTRTAVETLKTWMTDQERSIAGRCQEVEFPRRSVIWLAHTQELCEQAYACFKQVWEASTDVCPLLLVRLWGQHLKEMDEHPSLLKHLAQRPSVFVSTPQRLLNLISSNGESDAADLLRSTVSALVVDEAHRAAAPSYKKLISLIKAETEALRIIGLTATPFRLEYLEADPERGTKELREIFQNLVEPDETLGAEFPARLRELQERRILSKPQVTTIQTGASLQVSHEQSTADYSEDGIEAIDQALCREADSPGRRLTILKHVLEIAQDDSASILYFGPSVPDAECMAYLLLEQGVQAATVSAATRKAARRRIITDFKNQRLQVLCNCEVLTTGFDAPKVTHVVVARPTVSTVLYEQIVGRGLRGPQFGGTEVCHIINCDDVFPENLRRGADVFKQIWRV